MRTLLATFVVLWIVCLCQCSPTLDKYDNGYPSDSYEPAARGYPLDEKVQNDKLDENEITLEKLLRAYELIQEGRALDDVDTKGYGPPHEPVVTTEPLGRNIDLAQKAADTHIENEPEINDANQALRNFNAPRNPDGNTVTIDDSRDLAELEALALLTSSDQEFLREIEELELFDRARNTDPNCQLDVDCTNNENLNKIDDVEYRTIDGMCNNIEHPVWGMANVQHVRLLKNAYDDSKWRPRRDGKDGKRLDSPRKISNVVHNSTDDKTDGNTLAIALFYYMQFIDHDLAKTPEGHVDGSCCADPRPSGKAGKFCLRFDVRRRGEEDHFDDGYCFESRRSEIVKTCDGTILNQVNEITSYMDASMVYGSSKDEMDALRSFNGGELDISNENFPPISTDTHLPCNGTDKTEKKCFETGDFRANVHPGLTTYHTMFVREHNRIVKKLVALEMGWDDEKLFQEGRKIISAMIQHITYTYMLPKMFDAGKLEEYGVAATSAYDYNESTDSSLTQAFSMGYRLHHLMPKELHLAHEQGGEVEPYATVPQELVYLRPHFLTDDNYGGINKVALGMVQSSCPHVSRHMNNASRNLLFLDNDGNSLDLIALNIMRGREWGMPSYTEYVKLCSNQQIKTWEDLNGIMSPDAIEQLKKVYRNVQDIDLWTGLVSETPLSGSIAGPTHTCVLLKHFANIKFGDRFWYEADNEFTQNQLIEIKKTTLARILCSNLDGVTMMREDVFAVNSPWKSCTEIINDHDMDMSEWNPLN